MNNTSAVDVSIQAVSPEFSSSAEIPTEKIAAEIRSNFLIIFSPNS